MHCVPSGDGDVNLFLHRALLILRGCVLGGGGWGVRSYNSMFFLIQLILSLSFSSLWKMNLRAAVCSLGRAENFGKMKKFTKICPRNKEACTRRK